MFGCTICGTPSAPMPASAGLNAFMVRDLLGHKTMTMAGRYVSRNADPLRAAADVVSGQIAAAIEGKPAEVRPIRGGREQYVT